MKFASIIVGIYFVIMIIKGSIDNTFYTLVVLAFVLYGILKKKKTKRKYKKISSKKNNTTKLKNNKVNEKFNSYKIDHKKFNQNKYTNEPVNQTEQFSIEKKKISRLRQMKALSASNVTDTNKLFYLQGTFMDDYVDNYDINVPCNKNNPVYNNLTIYQLRSYFSWRTLIRNKLYKQTEQSYVFLYIYELLNKIGVKNEIDGLNKIIDHPKRVIEECKKIKSENEDETVYSEVVQKGFDPIGIFCFIFIFLCFAIVNLGEHIGPYKLNDIGKKLDYNEFISITLPDNAQISEELVYNSKMGKEKERNFEIKLNSKDKNNIEKSMKDSKNWIKGYLLKSDLYIFIDDFDYNDSSYYLIYNSDNKEYNSVPENMGVYKYYVASYNPNSTDGNIEISEFYYQYKK